MENRGKLHLIFLKRYHIDLTFSGFTKSLCLIGQMDYLHNYCNFVIKISNGFTEKIVMDFFINENNDIKFKRCFQATGVVCSILLY